ncbi:hypothetical protein NPIL_569711 [Nephila pilipes]|uniref:Uncharacterized protein n=1 Tax=Nephila pilipes TaxID=299642 RepID=A0A8X6TY99_NEPPI|nr:hypothetical protein NPIL_557011 [Nephila pilipes]GFT72543.1 hypothetical protein NPIL_569711 [Nephila pilipes]
MLKTKCSERNKNFLRYKKKRRKSGRFFERGFDPESAIWMIPGQTSLPALTRLFPPPPPTVDRSIKSTLPGQVR